ncbi:hypothetical protein [Sciscionella sediminilitoris]|uniref:hypothetical protein n=1 Tax=Sciscionella sediminilitoris TaxID=1445613 RepID=UPI00068E77F2|nr:hypothetical protein [Sciscionella sp. SE31]
MITEIAVERYAFSCIHCGRAWTADYDVQYIPENDGSLWAFYHHEGQATENPRADLLVCPDCGRSGVQPRLLSRREIPVADPSSTQPRNLVTTEDRNLSAPRQPTEQLTRPGGAEP